MYDGASIVPGCEVLVTDIVDTTVPVLGVDDTAWGAEQLATPRRGTARARRAALPAGALELLAAGDPGSPALLGAGPGLTPLGDDVLAGWLATAVACRHPLLPRIRSAVALAAPERTTVLSATLLACAARGEGVPEFRSLLSGVATRNLDVRRAVGRADARHRRHLRGGAAPRVARRPRVGHRPTRGAAP